MYLKELDLKDGVKCTCEVCNGTGVFKGYSEKDDIGVLCHYCNGKGYNTVYSKMDSHDIMLVEDEKTKIIYKVVDGIIEDSVTLFDKLQIRDDIKYVMYGIGKIVSTECLFAQGANEINLMSYKEFINGKYPLPLMRDTCPKFLSENYGNGEFDNDCKEGYMFDCEKFGTQECWKKFYGEAESIEEKQAVLEMIR